MFFLIKTTAQSNDQCLAIRDGYTDEGGNLKQFNLHVSTVILDNEHYMLINFESRRQFAVFLLALQKFVSAGFEVAVQEITRDGNHSKTHYYKLDTEPADFWRTVAMAQMYYKTA